MKILKLQNCKDIVEIQYNQQDSVVYIAEAQFYVRGTRANGGMNFELDEPDDVQAMIDCLTEIHAKMVEHYKKTPLLDKN